MNQRCQRLLITVLFFLSGCATLPSNYGNHLEHDSMTYNRIIADDIAGQLTNLYPPASTTINLQTSEDNFTRTLIENLRVTGYAVRENQDNELNASINTSKPAGVYNGDRYQHRHNKKNNKKRVKKTAAQKTAQTTTQTTVPTTNTQRDAWLAYMLDQSDDLYRISLIVDDQILTRAYRPHNGSLYPAGSWTRRK